jgi:NAD(P)-dependent dehydrogenase (short-subunit alcohol dehydrogenase family)
MACRSVDRGEEAAAEIRPVDGTLDVRACDLASLASVQSVADDLAADYDSIDLLCNNAGVMAIPRRETADGFEMQLGVTHFGHFALTAHLFDRLTAGDREARVVTQSSGMHERGAMDFADLNWEQSYDKWDAYGRSKLANVLFAYELQRRLDDHGYDGLRSVACHPGYADTNLQATTAEASGSRLVQLGMGLANRLFAQSAAKGALPMLYAATADVDGGTYVGPGGFMNMRGAPEVQASSDASYDAETARRLWDRSAEATGVRFPFDED